MQSVEQFIDKNFYTANTELVNTLLEKEIVTYEDINNYNTDEDGEYPEIFEWYSVNGDMYDRLTKAGCCTLQIYDAFYYGREIYGQLFIQDFESDERLKSII